MIEITEDLLRRALAGDPDAHEQALALLPKAGNIIGRWATHPKLGRVLCGSAKPDQGGEVRIVTLSNRYVDGTIWEWVPLSTLEFDPTELVTEQDFHDAPEGTIVANKVRCPREKHLGVWHAELNEYTNQAMTGTAPWQVLRWGKGEQA